LKSSELFTHVNNAACGKVFGFLRNPGVKKEPFVLGLELPSVIPGHGVNTPYTFVTIPIEFGLEFDAGPL